MEVLQLHMFKRKQHILLLLYLVSIAYRNAVIGLQNKIKQCPCSTPNFYNELLHMPMESVFSNEISNMSS